jgi:general secretion pathway protein F
VARYNYKAVTGDGRVVHGGVDALDRQAAVKLIRQQGQVPIRVDEGVRPAATGARRPRLRRRVDHEQLAAFTRELATLLRSGQPIDGALSILMSIAGEGSAFNAHLARIRAAVKGGQSLSEALAAENGLFSDFYVHMVRAGESGGALDSVLSRLAVHMAHAKEVRDALVSALIYPLILMLVAVASIMILMVYVIPQFAELFQDMGQALPLSTRITMAVAGALQDYGWLLALGLAGAAAYFRWQLRQPRPARRWHARALRLPLLGAIIRQVEAARFCRTLGTLLENGVPLLRAVAIVKDTIGNRAIAEALEGVVGSLKSGRRLADPLAEHAGFPAFAIEMIRIGEESGQLEPMLIQTADILDQETQTLIKRGLSLVEPVMILVLGVIIAAVVMSILVAILGVNQLVAL